MKTSLFLPAFLLAALFAFPASAAEYSVPAEEDDGVGVVSEQIQPIDTGSEEAGIRLAAAEGLGGDQPEGALAPIQFFEILRPDGAELSIGRLGTSCKCIQVTASKRTFAPGERALLDLRNVLPTPPDGMNYQVYVLVTQPEQVILRITTFVRSN